MSDPIEALGQFYESCDRAVPPESLSWLRRLWSQSVETVTGGITPFLAAFAGVALLLTWASSSGAGATPPSAVFPAALQSAGLSLPEAAAVPKPALDVKP